MTRQEIAANGITSVFCLAVRGSAPPEYLCPPNRFGDVTSPEEERAEVWVREIDALEMKRRAEHLAGLKLEMVRRPTLIGGADPYCPKCGHVGSHNPFCGSLRKHAHHRDCYDDAGPGAGGVSLICGLTTSDLEPELVRLKDGRELPITVTELAAGMATADFREERGEADRG